MNDFIIRNMKPSELKIAIDWAQKEGWNPGIHDAETFYFADPHGFFIGELKGEPIAVASEVCYDQSFGFFGLYIVKPGYRGQGYGLQLTKHCLAYTGDINTGLDGVLENVKIYERLGYRLAHHNYRYMGLALKNNQPSDPRVMPYHHGSMFEDVKKLDRQCFPAKRDAFLDAWLEQPDAKAVVYFNNNELLGYALRRKCFSGHKVGPLFAKNKEVAHALFMDLQQDIVGEQIFLDIPETNPEALALVSHFKMSLVFETARMYLKGIPELNNHWIYGFTTFEVG